MNSKRVNTFEIEAIDTADVMNVRQFIKDLGGVVQKEGHRRDGTREAAYIVYTSEIDLFPKIRSALSALVSKPGDRVS